MPSPPPHRTLAIIAATSLGGCAALLDFDAGTEEGSGGGATSGATTTGTSSGAEVSTGPGGGSSGDGGGGGVDCAGCMSDGACLAGDEDEACGREGGSCLPCETTECADGGCEDGACSADPLADGTECIGGRCRTGVCEPNEDCTDGLDDDSDGFIDCADDDCATFSRCLPLTPAGWLGPFAVYEGPEGVNCPVTWPEPLAVPLAGQLAEGAITCPVCSCNPTCTVTTYAAAGNDQCMPAVWSQGTLTSGQCLPIPVADNLPQEILATRPVPTCPAVTTGTPVFEQNRYDTVVTACGGGPESECTAGVCKRVVPDDALATERVCIAAHGAYTCPAEWPDPSYVDAAEPYEGRSCRTCACSGPTALCGGSVQVFADAACTLCANGTATCATSENSCLQLGAGPFHMGYDALNDPGCSAIPSVVQGQVSMGDPWTLCCQPPPLSDD